MQESLPVESLVCRWVVDVSLALFIFIVFVLWERTPEYRTSDFLFQLSCIRFRRRLLLRWTFQGRGGEGELGSCPVVPLVCRWILSFFIHL